MRFFLLVKIMLWTTLLTYNYLHDEQKDLGQWDMTNWRFRFYRDWNLSMFLTMWKVNFTEHKTINHVTGSLSSIKYSASAWKNHDSFGKC